MMGVAVFGILKIPEGLGRSSSGICLLLGVCAFKLPTANSRAMVSSCYIFVEI